MQEIIGSRLTSLYVPNRHEYAIDYMSTIVSSVLWLYHLCECTNDLFIITFYLRQESRYLTDHPDIPIHGRIPQVISISMCHARDVPTMTCVGNNTDNDPFNDLPILKQSSLLLDMI